ncbi:hypothetical protein LTR35_010664 [Friedmanniomyces endolithicus]|nr:hypothetical protein LTR35_010664 [Friedmanniomyces endolithicus]KAK0301006.1 hypothetical protein LTS00_000154 [Friedmanniomyces endolithicus]
MRIAMVHLAKSRLDDGHFSTEEVRRREKPALSTSRPIAFTPNHYDEPPNLAAGFSSLDVSCEGPIRANLIADNITKDGFRIAIETWGQSTLYAADGTFIERKATAKECIFGQFDTQDASFSPAKSATAPRAATTRKLAVQTEPVPRKYAKRFDFPQPFKEPVEVVCWLNRLDMTSGRDRDYKIRAFADEGDEEGFTAHLNTWDNGELHGAAMCWIAFPKLKPHVDSGRFTTTDVRKRTDPRPKTSSRVKFKQRFAVVPTVLTALSMLDTAGNADLRVRVSVSEVSREGFRWTLETWGDSTLYAAGASWIALGFP